MDGSLSSSLVTSPRLYFSVPSPGPGILRVSRPLHRPKLGDRADGSPTPLFAERDVIIRGTGPILRTPGKGSE